MRAEDRGRRDVDARRFPEVNIVFGGSEARPSKIVYMKLEREVLTTALTTRRLEWWQQAITFGPKDHPNTELSYKNVSFVVKIPICQHNVAKTLLDSGSTLNLLMKNTLEIMRLPS